MRTLATLLLAGTLGLAGCSTIQTGSEPVRSECTEPASRVMYYYKIAPINPSDAEAGRFCREFGGSASSPRDGQEAFDDFARKMIGYIGPGFTSDGECFPSEGVLLKKMRYTLADRKTDVVGTNILRYRLATPEESLIPELDKMRFMFPKKRFYVLETEDDGFFGVEGIGGWGAPNIVHTKR